MSDYMQAMPPPLSWHFACAAPIAVNTPVLVKNGSGLKCFVKAFQYINIDPAVASEILLLDGATVIWRGYAPAAMTHPATMYFGEGGLQVTAGANVNVQLVTAATATYADVQGVAWGT